MTMKKAFTLAEIIVVVGIVGILAAVILVSMNSSKKTAKDQRIKAAVSRVPMAAAAYKDSHENYNALVCGASPTCVNLSGDTSRTTIAQIAQDISANQSSLTINAGVTVGPPPRPYYVVFAQLVSDSTKYYCVDSLANPNGVIKPSAPSGESC